MQSICCSGNEQIKRKFFSYYLFKDFSFKHKNMYFSFHQRFYSLIFKS